MKINKLSERLVEILLRISAGASVLAIIIITFFIFYKGIPLIAKVGIIDFLFNLKWDPTNGSFGIGAMVIGSLAVTFSSLVWSVPLGILTAILMAEIAPPKLADVLARFVELLAGIPSVVYGFFGLIVIVPFIRNHMGGVGLSVLAGAIILGIMILPTIINISRDAVAAIPKEYKKIPWLWVRLISKHL
jgi:phosphate transport system permease protein